MHRTCIALALAWIIWVLSVGCSSAPAPAPAPAPSGSSGIWIFFPVPLRSDDDEAGPGMSATEKRLLLGFAALLATITLAVVIIFRLRSRSRCTSRICEYEFGDSARRYLLEVRQFSFKELELATGYFAESRRLGDGGFGTVYAGILQDGRIVAVKMLHHCPRQTSLFMSEIAILSQFKHPNLVDLIGCSSDGESLLVVYELVNNGTLFDHLHNQAKPKLPWLTRMSIAIDIAQVIAFLHARCIFHRDIKSSNILLDQSFHAKLGDFGLSRLSADGTCQVITEPRGTAGYLDPDYYHCYQLTDKSDVYSFGVLLMEIITSKAAVDFTRDKKLINLASYAVGMIQAGTFEDIIDPHLETAKNSKVREMVLRVAEIAFECLAINKEDRPCMKSVANKLVNVAAAQ